MQESNRLAIDGILVSPFMVYLSHLSLIRSAFIHVNLRLDLLLCVVDKVGTDT